MIRSIIAVAVALSIGAPQVTFALGRDSRVQLSQSSAGIWLGQSVTIHLRDNKVQSGKVVGIEADAFVVRDSAGAIKRVPYAQVTAVQKSHRTVWIIVGIAAAAVTALILYKNCFFKC